MNVKIYVSDVAPLENEEYFKEMYKTVSESRQKKIDRLRFQNDKLLSLGVQLLLNKALGEIGITDKNPEIPLNEHGKPYFENIPDIHFNLSHSGTKVMCAVFSSPVGCDVEKVQKPNLAIAEKFFSNEEYEFISAKETESEQADFFYRIWTLKESFIKCTGLGLSLPLNKFSVIPETDKIRLQQNVYLCKYDFFEPNIIDGYKYACCVKNEDLEKTEFSVKEIVL